MIFLRLQAESNDRRPKTSNKIIPKKGETNMADVTFTDDNEFDEVEIETDCEEIIVEGESEVEIDEDDVEVEGDDIVFEPED